MQAEYLFIGNNQKGSVLVAAVAFSLIFTIVIVSLISFIQHSDDLVDDEIDMIKRYWAHESALNLAFEMIYPETGVAYGTYAGEGSALQNTWADFCGQVNGITLNVTINNPGGGNYPYDGNNTIIVSSGGGQYITRLNGVDNWTGF